MEIVYILVGSFLIFLFSWVIEGTKDRKKNKEKEKTIKLLLRQELISISNELSKLKSALEYRNYFEIKILNFLDEKIKYIDKYKKYLLDLPNVRDREIFIKLISDTKSFLSDTRILENIYLENIKKDNKDKSKPDDNFFIRKRLENLVFLVEIKRRIEEFYKKYDY